MGVGGEGKEWKRDISFEEEEVTLLVMCRRRSTEKCASVSFII
jgi:hypothetical protein